VIVFIDDDIELEPDFAAELMGVWERRGLLNLSGVVGTCVNDDSFPQGSVARRVLLAAGGLGHEALFAKGSRRMLSGSVAIVRRPKDEVEVAFATTQSVSYRRDLLELEPFDESFNGYVFGEDIDLAARMARHAPIIHSPRARCWHATTTGGLGSGPDAVYRKARMGAYYRGRYRAPGLIGRAAWEWSNAAEFAIVAASALRSRDLEAPRVFLRALRETRAHLKAKSCRGRD